MITNLLLHRFYVESNHNLLLHNKYRFMSGALSTMEVGYMALAGELKEVEIQRIVFEELG